ncbi:MAG: ABC transporter ATP-binding protein [Chloroflexota bacterium]
MLITKYGSLLRKYLARQRLLVLILSITLLSSVGLEILKPQILRNFIDMSIEGSTLQALMLTALIFFGTALLAHAVSVVVAYTGENVAWTATNELRSDLVEHCLHLKMSFHNLRTPGEMIERVDGDVTTLSNFFSLLVIGILGDCLLIGGVLIVLFAEDWRVGVCITLFILSALLLIASIWGKTAAYHWAYRQVVAEMTSFIEERLSGLEDIVANGGQGYLFQRLDSIIRERFRKLRKASFVGVIVINITNITVVTGTTVGLGIGAYLYFMGDVSVGSVYMIYHYTGVLVAPVWRIGEQLRDLQQATASITRIHELFEQPCGESCTVHATVPITDTDKRRTVVDTASIPSKLTAPPTVQFDEVSFAYPTSREISESTDKDSNDSDKADEHVLKNVSFTLPAGNVLGLLGRTGSGKTTISRLLFRLYEPTTGTIRLCEDDISHFSPVALRDQIGLVTQDVQLFHATLRDNLTFFNPVISDDAIRHALDQLSLTEWLAKQPDGLETMIRSAGGNLSAGEAQLIAFTRVFLKDPMLVILDEASSRLDPATEQLLEGAIDKLLDRRTSIIIAHRLTTIQRADQILILSDGSIQENGTSSELMADPNSYFYQLMQSVRTLS